MSTCLMVSDSREQIRYNICLLVVVASSKIVVLTSIYIWVCKPNIYKFHYYYQRLVFCSNMQLITLDFCLLRLIACVRCFLHNNFFSPFYFFSCLLFPARTPANKASIGAMTARGKQAATSQCSLLAAQGALPHQLVLAAH